MQHSIILYSKAIDASDSFRLDADFFQVEKLLDKVRKYKTLPLKRISRWITQGPNPVFSDKGVPCLTGRNIANGELNFNNSDIVDEGEYLSLERFRLIKNDILITLKGAGSTGKVILYDSNKRAIFSRNLGLIRIEDNSQITPELIFVFLVTNPGQKIIDRGVTGGTGQLTLPTTYLKNLEVPQFSTDLVRDVTKCIGECLSLKSRSKKKYIEAQTLLLSELGLLGWKPKHRLSFVKNYSYTKQAERFDAEYFPPKYDDLLETIENYSQYTCRISSIQKYNARGLQPVYCSDGPLHVIASRHILETDLDYENFDHTNSSNWVDQSRARVYEGDILTYTTGANIGRTAVYSSNKPALASNHVNILRIEKENPEYVGFVMNSIVGRLQTERLSTGSAQAELYPKDIGSFVIPFIALDKQKEIVQGINQSRLMKQKSKYMLESAKQAVEMAIEKDEETAMRWLENQTDGIGRGN